MNLRPGKNQCPHSVWEPKKISEDKTELYCISCGQLVGSWEKVAEDKTFIAGKVPELTEEQKIKGR